MKLQHQGQRCGNFHSKRGMGRKGGASTLRAADQMFGHLLHGVLLSVNYSQANNYIIWKIATHVRDIVWLESLSWFLCVCVRACVWCARVYMRAYVRACVLVCVRARVRACVRACMCVC